MVNSDKQLTTKLTKTIEAMTKDAEIKEAATTSSTRLKRKMQKRTKVVSTTTSTSTSTALATKDKRYSIINNISRTIFVGNKV